MKTFIRVGDLVVDPIEVIAFWPFDRRNLAVSLRGREGDLVVPGASVEDMKDAIISALEVQADA